MGYNCVKLNLSQLEETGDISGLPLKEYHMCKPNMEDCRWVPEALVPHFMQQGYTWPEGHTRMSYATPKWLPKDSTKPLLLLLDDYNRCIPVIMAAVMELIDRREFVGWELPPFTQIILSSNPEGGDYLVAEQDNANKTRYISLQADFDVDVLAQYLESYGLPDVFINFILKYPEVFNKEGGVQTVNARSYVTFANACSGLKDLSTTESLAFIHEIARGCFTSKKNRVGTLFTQFIENKLDKLPTVHDLFHKDWSKLRPELEHLLYQGSGYRADIANVLNTRILNKAIDMAKKNECIDPVVNRFNDFCDGGKEIFSEDLFFGTIKTLLGNEDCKKKYGAKLSTNIKLMKKIF